MLRNKTTVSGAPKDGRQNILTPVNFVYAFKTHIVIDRPCSPLRGSWPKETSARGVLFSSKRTHHGRL